MLSFQDHLRESRITRLQQEIAYHMVISGHSIEEAAPLLPLNEGFFSRLGAAWKAFWNPEQETYTKEKVEDLLSVQSKAMQAMIQTLTEELRKAGFDNQNVEKMLEKVKKHFAGVSAAVQNASDVATTGVGAAQQARAGNGPTSSVHLPADPGQAWDILQGIPRMQWSGLLDDWWAALPDSEKQSLYKVLGVSYPISDINGDLLRIAMYNARKQNKI